MYLMLNILACMKMLNIILIGMSYSVSYIDNKIGYIT